MCGIVGIYSFTKKGKDVDRSIESALSSLRKRGPDSSGVYLGETIGLGHARLSIIDLSPAADQPLKDVTGRYIIIANAEIYNYRDLRNSLTQKGITFRTLSDTEVLLYLYIHEGPECLNRLNGFFSFAVYDELEDTLFIARDRFGIKPLLFFQDAEKFVFASEMKALLEMNIPREIDGVSLQHYFQFNYIPPPHSIFRNVLKLKPGHYMTIRKNQVKTKQYYSIPQSESSPDQGEYRDVQKTIRSLLSESVQKRMVSDVSLGSFLSGGVDSSILVSEAVKHRDKLDTFSIGYKDALFFDETKYAVLAARKFGTSHHTFRLSIEDLHRNLHLMLDDISEPFADSSAIAVHILSRLASRYVKVALSGDGGDELFGGYHKHRAHFHSLHPGLSSSLIRWSEPLWRKLPKSRNSRITNFSRQLQRYAKGLTLSAAERYWLWATVSGAEEVGDLLRDTADPKTSAARKELILHKVRSSKRLSDILLTDMQLVLEGDMLHKVDTMSMAHGLEVRTPYLDHNLVNFCFGLDDTFKITSRMNKRVLRDAYRDQLPPEIYRRRKQGFEIPLLHWFRTELRGEIDTTYLSPGMIEQQQIFNPEGISRLKRQLFSTNPGDAPARMWALIVFQHWWLNYMV